MYNGYEKVEDFKSRSDKYKELDSSEQYELTLIEEGRIPLYPADNELFVDIDTKNQESLFHTMISCLKRNDPSFKTIEVFKKESKTRGHWHYIVKLPFVISHLERICLQACLGSDHFRETLSYLRNKRGDINPVIFAEEVTVKEPEKEMLDFDINIDLNEICSNCGKRYGSHYGSWCEWNKYTSIFVGSGNFRKK